jgi:hypothetical protein
MKIITNYEVEGCWSSSKSGIKCRACGTEMQSVPKENHYNSKYWRLSRNDGLGLVCCPKGCNVKEAEKRMKEFLKIQYYCIIKSESWNYKLDYNKIKDAWIDRQGKVYPLGTREHNDFAFEHNTDERTLEKKGWLKLTSVEFFWEKKLSQQQINMIFDYIMITGIKKDVKNFQEYIDRDVGVFKLEGVNNE